MPDDIASLPARFRATVASEPSRELLAAPLDLADPRVIALRRECEALAAEYRAPLPEGDAGLFAAVNRWRELRPRREFSQLDYDCAMELAVIAPIVGPAQTAFEQFIEQTPAQGLLGVAAKLRYALEWGDGMIGLEDIEGAQLVEVIEQAALPAVGGGYADPILALNVERQSPPRTATGAIIKLRQLLRLLDEGAFELAEDETVSVRQLVTFMEALALRMEPR